MLFQANTELTRDDLKLNLVNQEGYAQNAYSVRYTVINNIGKAVSGQSLIATNRFVGEYYAPWITNVPNGSYQVRWEVQLEECGSTEFLYQHIFVVDSSSYFCNKKASLQVPEPSKGSRTFLPNTQLGIGDLDLFLRTESGYLSDAYSVFWTIYDSTGKQWTPKTQAIQFGVGSYYADWYVLGKSGDYYISWEYMKDSDSPLQAAKMDFSIICPSVPVTSGCSCSCCDTKETQMCTTSPFIQHDRSFGISSCGLCDSKPLFSKKFIF